MPAANEEFGSAVRSVLQWLGCSAEAAGPQLGIKPQTLNAMCSGIVPMRSLVIRFAEEVARRAQGETETAEWWRDVDAWLAMAGYPPRRDIFPRPGRPAAPAAAARAGPLASQPSAEPPRPPSTPTLSPRPAPPAGAVEEDGPAANFYRPAYERMPWAGEHIHIFWLYDRNDTRTHMFRFPAPADYRRRAQRLKHDLATMTRAQFERRYAAYRLEKDGPAAEEPEPEG